MNDQSASSHALQAVITTYVEISVRYQALVHVVSQSLGVSPEIFERECAEYVNSRGENLRVIASADLKRLLRASGVLDMESGPSPS